MSPSDRALRRVPFTGMSRQLAYAESGGVTIAYSTFGDGPDLVVAPGFISHLEVAWEEPSLRHFVERLASFRRVINFDKRGTGLSDPVAHPPTIEENVDDLRSVMDAAGSERADIFGVSEGGAMASVFAATRPDRTNALVLYGSYPRFMWAPDYLFGISKEQHEGLIELSRRGWGGGVGLGAWAPSRVGDARLREWWGRLQRMAVSPGMVGRIFEQYLDLDIRDVLPTISVPTLVLQRRHDRMVVVDHGRYLAEHIPGARYVELDGTDHLFFTGDADALLDEIEEFLTGTRRGPEPDRILATVLFTDLVDSTGRAAELGDARWRELLESHRTQVRRQLERFRGREVKTLGDGFMATFDGPARAVRCAQAVVEQSRSLELEVRVGVHAGECELMDDDVGGIAVHIAARIADLADGGEVLVSSTVKDLVAGSGLVFDHRGEQTLKGVPDPWRIYAAKPDRAR